MRWVTYAFEVQQGAIVAGSGGGRPWDSGRWVVPAAEWKAGRGVVEAREKRGSTVSTLGRFLLSLVVAVSGCLTCWYAGCLDGNVGQADALCCLPAVHLCRVSRISRNVGKLRHFRICRWVRRMGRVKAREREPELARESQSEPEWATVAMARKWRENDEAIAWESAKPGKKRAPPRTVYCNGRWLWIESCRLTKLHLIYYSINFSFLT